MRKSTRRALTKGRMSRTSPFKQSSKRIPLFCGLKFAFRLASICTILGFVILWVTISHVYLQDKAAVVDDERDTALGRLFGEHGEEIQSAIRNNWQWFREYLSQLRKLRKSRALVAAADDEDDEERGSGSSRGVHAGRAGGSSSSHGSASKSDRSGSAGLHSGGDAKAKHKTKSAQKAAAIDELNSLEMPMRKVHGKMEPCLKLLPEADIDRLELPPPRPEGVGELKYYQLDQEARAIEEAGGQARQGKAAALDMFAGKQTMGERAESYKVSKGMEVHCGFAGQDTGFDMSPKDQEYLNSCKVAVVTAAFGGGDILAQPIGMTKTSLVKVCYVAFWDDITLNAQQAEGVSPDPVTGHVGVWRVVLVKNLPFLDQRRNGKIPKILPHRLFPNAQYSIWVDSKYQFRRDPMGVLEALLWRPKAIFAISEHGARNCIYAEGEAIVAKHKALPEEVAIQLNQYRTEGLPVNATFNGRKALAEASVIVREHNFVTNLFMCLWFNEMVRFTARDQLSFGYVLRRYNLLKPNMFPVCTRRALVNRLGHKRKAKPLQRTASP